MQEILNIFLPYMERMNMYSFIFLAFILLLFILTFVLGVLLWRVRFVGGFLIFIACFIPFVAPFLLKWGSKNIFFPVEIALTTKQLTYSPTFLITGTMTPLGKFPIKGCVMNIALNKKSLNTKQKIITFFKPMFVEKKTLEGPFVRGSNINIQHAIDNIHEEVMSDIDISCY